MKKLFFVSYDLINPGKNYDSVVGKLKSLGATRILLSEWALRSYKSAAELRDDIRPYMDSNDRLMVSEVTNWASYNAMTDVNKVAA